MSKLKVMVIVGCTAVLALGTAAISDAQLPGTGSEKCFQNPATLECAPTWIYTCNCDPEDQ